jgi:hypothetical protein
VRGAGEQELLESFRAAQQEALDRESGEGRLSAEYAEEQCLIIDRVIKVYGEGSTWSTALADYERKISILVEDALSS